MTSLGAIAPVLCLLLITGASIVVLTLMVAGTVYGSLYALETGSWTFTYDGRTYVVRNYAARETIEVDGTVLADTWVSGHASRADHALQLADGRQLDIRVDGGSDGMTCTARVGDTLVFDSERHMPPARTALPASEGPVVASADPRRAPAQQLLDALASDPTHADAAHTLARALDEALQALARVQEARAAHLALGATDPTLDAMVTHREADVERVLELLRQRHVAALAHTAVPEPSEALGRLEAEREVDELALKRALAQRSRQRS